jgi:hypothetical protein
MWNQWPAMARQLPPNIGHWVFRRGKNIFEVSNDYKV